MKRSLIAAVLALAFTNPGLYSQTPDPLSFFPRHIGDRWDYVYSNGGFIGPLILTRDSSGVDGSHNLMYNNATDPSYRVDTTLSVFWLPQVPSLNYLYYKLEADSGEAWRIRPLPNYGLWAWVAHVDSETIFGRRTLVKKYRYSPGHPDSGGTEYYLEEHWLAEGFGLIYKWQEPFDVTYLRGCIIAGDTFGFVTSVKFTSHEYPRNFILEQNYPNPFNPTTTIQFTLPLDADVSILVFNILGEQIETVFQGKLKSGMHRLMWNAGNASSGVYFCRMQANGRISTIKMLLTK